MIGFHNMTIDHFHAETFDILLARFRTTAHNHLARRWLLLEAAHVARRLRARTLSRASYWQGLIDSGEVANASSLARHSKLKVRWVCEVLQMTRLAPDTIRAILDEHTHNRPEPPVARESPETTKPTEDSWL